MILMIINQISNNKIIRRKSNSDLNMKLKFKYIINFIMFSKYLKKNIVIIFYIQFHVKERIKIMIILIYFFSLTKILSEKKFLSKNVNTLLKKNLRIFTIIK